MESQRNEAGRSHDRGFDLSGGHRSGRSLMQVVAWLICGAALWIGIAQAQTTGYVYDANGRVVAVTTNNASSVQYHYDTLGHVGPISTPLATSQLAIFAFTPAHGEAGVQVTIQGQGFDNNPANDTVSFNGTVATVLSASATQLVTSVPSGATTGPISVAADGQAVTSATAFVIDDTGLPPAITEVSPLIASVGSTITVTGTHLDPMAGSTMVQMGDRAMTSLASISDSQLQYAVPSDGTTGFVTVETPYGLAASSTPVVVLPGGVSAASVVSSANVIVNGSGANLSIGSSGQIGAVSFVAPASGWASLQASGIATTASAINYTVYAPGNGVLQQGTVSSTSPSIHLPRLIGGATYLVLVQPSGGGVQMTLGVQANALLATNTAATVVTAVPGQSERVLFNASAGQNLAFQIIGTSTNPAGHSVTYTVYSPSGGSYTSAATSTTGVINLGRLPASGIYQVIVAPGAGVTGSMQVEIIPGVTGALSAAPQTYTASVPGQNIYLSFTATQGENLELTFNHASLTGASTNQFQAVLYNSAGGSVASYQCTPSNPGASCSMHLWYLPEGQYSLVVTPIYGGTISFSALLQDDIVGPALVPNSPQNVTLAAGQVERFTFNANVGDTVALNVSGVTTTPAGQGVTFLVYRPDAGAITTITGTYTSFGPSSSQAVNLSNLPVSGTYTVIVAPNYGLAASAQLSLVSGATGTLNAGAASQDYAASVAGQNIYLSFAATQGENLELVLNHVSLTGASSNSFQVNVYNSAGAGVTSIWCYPTNPGASCNVSLWNLPAGQYTAIATPTSGGAISFNALLQDDTVGPALVPNSPQNVSLAAGQVERFTFNATAGQTVALSASGVTTTPTGQGVAFLVYRPDAGAITSSAGVYTAFSTASAQTVNLPNLPVSGTYTVIVQPGYGLAAGAQLSLVSGAGGSIAANGGSQSYAASIASQNIYLSFTATQGENLELTLNQVSVTGASGNGFPVYVYNAAGAQITEQWCYPTNPGASCNLHLWYLPAGQYSVVATPNYGGVISFNALLQDDVVGPTIASGATANIALAAGQVERYTFNANAGDTMALNVAGVTTAPTGQGLTFQVYRPDAGAISTGTPSYTAFSATSLQAVNLPSLPVSGTYTVIVSQAYGLPAGAQLSLVPGVAGTMSAGAASKNYTANVAGQNIYLSFAATQGENLELALNQLNITGATSNQFQVNVFNAVGAQVTNTECAPSSAITSCNLHLWYLPAGQYSVVVVPNYGGTISLHALMQDDIVGPTIASGDTANVSLGAGQVERYTFNANVGDTVALNVSGVTTTPAAQVVGFQVYRPDAGAITTGTAAYTSFTTASTQTVNLSNLPVSGAYTVIVSPSYGLPATAQWSLSDTSGNPPTYGTATLPDNGVQQSRTASAAGQGITMTFNANQGDNLELALSNLAISGGSSTSASVNVYGPTGSNLYSTNSYSISNPGAALQIPLWNLAAGTYSVTVSPSQSTQTISVNAVLQPDTIGPALTANSPVAVNLAQGQAERFTFNATYGSTVALNLSNVATTAPAGQAVYVNIYRPDKGLLTTTNYYTQFSASSAGTINLPNLPASGTYTAVVYTTYGTPAAAQLSLVPGAAATLVDGASQSVAAGAAGQNIYLNFNANAGDNLELALSNLVISGGNSNYNYVTVNVYGPAGNNLYVNNSYSVSNPGAGLQIPLWNLIAGTYSVIVSPAQGNQSISLNAIVQPDGTGQTLTAGSPTTANLAQGQAERFTFNANQGGTVALNLSNVVTTSPSGQAVYVNVYRPDVGLITTGNYYTQFAASGGNTLNLANLPVSGTYTAVVYTQYATAATAQLALVPGVATTLTSGVSQSYAANAPGENIYMSFNANLGDNLELALSNLAISGGSSSYMSVNVYGPAGNNVFATNSYSPANPGGALRIPLWNLSAGTYSVIVSPAQASQSISLNAIVQPDTVAQALTVGSPATVSLTQGQTERFTFNASQGSTVALNLSNVTTTSPAGQAIYVNVYRPDTGAITTGNNYTQFASGSQSTLNLSNLPASGTYTAVVYTTYGTPGAGQLTLAAGAAATLTDGINQSYAASTAGENIYLNFNANTGDNLELALSNLVVSGGGNTPASIIIHGPTGNTVYSGSLSPNASGAVTQIPLWNLAAGTYSVVISPNQPNQSLSINAIVQPDTIGPALTANSPVTVNLAQGQTERFTFNANLGQTVVMNLSGVSTTGPAGQTVYVNIYRPDVGAITMTNAYTNLNASSSNTLTLSNLPAAGTYIAVVYTSYGTPANAQLTFAPQ